jgi:hypothetical protein
VAVSIPLNRSRPLARRGKRDDFLRGSQCCFRAIAENLLHPIRRFLVGTFENVPLQIQGQFYGRRTEMLCHFLRVNSLGAQQRGVRVTQIVKPHLRKPGVFQNLLKTVQHIRGIDRRADARREDQLLLLPGSVA